MPQVRIIVDSHNRLVGVFKTDDVNTDITQINIRCAEKLAKPDKGSSPNTQAHVDRIAEKYSTEVAHLREQVYGDHSFHLMRFKPNYGK